jgi:putative transposase
MKTDHSNLTLCATLHASPSGYYDWCHRLSSPGPRALQTQALRQKIKELHAQSRQTYGSPRLVMELRKTGSRHGRNRIARIMQQEGLCGRQKGRYRVQTTDSNHHEPIAPNRLADAPRPTAPNQIWVGDITYIDAGAEGWLYVAAILDLSSRKIVGWAMSERIDTALILNALSMALLHRQPAAHLLFHSDRGIQYASGDYRRALARSGLTASMSRKGNCYDNAAMESFWSTLKMELVYRRVFLSRSQAKQEIFHYIETFYNRQRTHSALGYRSPVDFELQNN